MRPHRPAQSKVMEFTRQQIKLAGLGSPTFEKTVNILRQLDSILSRPHPAGKVIPFDTTAACGHTALEPATRYFTSRKDDSNSEDLPFDKYEDPKGVLEGMRKDTHFHGEDNKVLYFALIVEDNQKK